MTQHTPGDWILEDGNFIYVLSQHNINRFSCHIQGGSTDQGTRTTREELAANARLIAAAPDLLAALIEVQQTIALEQFGLLNVVNDALAKVNPQLDRRN